MGGIFAKYTFRWSGTTISHSICPNKLPFRTSLVFQDKLELFGDHHAQPAQGQFLCEILPSRVAEGKQIFSIKLTNLKGIWILLVKSTLIIHLGILNVSEILELNGIDVIIILQIYILELESICDKTTNLFI
jgi:hypothetical protein